MEKSLRSSAGLVVLALILAACQASASSSPSESAAATGAVDPVAACEALELGCVEVPAGEPLTVASALAITGAVAFLGNDANFGIQVAQEERGQVLGRDVEVIHEDAGCGDAASGQTAAESIVANPAILGVMGTTCSRTAVPMMPVLEAAGLTNISPSNTAVSLTQPGHANYGGEFYFRTAYSDFFQGSAVAKFLCEELGVTTIATIHDGSPYAEELQQVAVDQFAEQCDGETTSQDGINVGDTDFHALLTTIAANSPEVIFLPIFSPEGPLFVTQSQEIPGLADTIMFGADGVKDGAMIKGAGDLAQEIGMYFSGPDLNYGGRYIDEFLPAYYALSGTETVLAPYGGQAYDAYNILMDAIVAAHVGDDADGTSYFSKEAIREYVAGLTDYPGLTGTLTCDENGDCGAREISIDQLEDGVFVPVFSTREP